MTAFIPPYKQPLVEDNNIRGNSSLADYAKLRPAFDRKHGTVTAANSTPLTDGAAAVILMTESRRKKLGLVPLGYLRSYAFTAMMSGRTCCSVQPGQHRWRWNVPDCTIGDLTLIDMHEAFAAQTLANIQLLGSERFARDVLGRAHATGEVDEQFNALWRFDCLRASLRSDRRADDYPDIA